jgi:OOP family OmpA-OmpF porin
MKRIFILNFLFILIYAQLQFAQAVKDSWSLGFGFSYPRFLSTDVRPDEANYGGFISLQRNFSEDVALRLHGAYNHITGFIQSGNYFYSNGAPVTSEKMFSNVISGNLDLLYYFDPCSPASPYLGLGAGAAYYEPDWGDVVNPQAESETAPVFNLFFGTEWRLGEHWNLVTELGIHSTASAVDGVINNNRQGVFGSHSDAYITVNAGLQYYFSKGEPSRICDLYNGIRIEIPEKSVPTLEEIENIARRYAERPSSIDYNQIEEIIKKYPCEGESWVLFGVNFEFNKAVLTIEAYPILDHAAEILMENPSVNVEIQGHTDNIGSESYNLSLSEKRAAVVKDYLVSKGINTDRLTAAGYGEARPLSDNTTSAGRAKNRRVEFKTKK